MSTDPQVRIGPGFDPSQCDRMVIHQPGLIQPHGAVLVARADTGEVVQASANTARWLGKGPADLLGRSLAHALGVAEAGRLAAVAAAERLDAGPRFALSLPPRGDVPPLDVSIHSRDGLWILELEAAGRSTADGSEPYRLVRDAVARLQSSADVDAFCRALTEEVRRISGFDRVMVYRFLPDMSGRVIAESIAEGLVPFLDKRFPAGDVPRPARELMARNWLRLVPDVHFEPVPVVPEINPVTGRPLDMTDCLLRHSSSMCTTYLKNMGSAAQMTLSLMRDGALWGMISCHHREPRPVPYAVRAACEVVAQVASLQVAAAEDRASLGRRLVKSEARDRLLASLDRADDPAAWLLTHLDEIAGYIDADGLALGSGGRAVSRGRTPDEAGLRGLLDWLSAGDPARVLAAEGLSEWYPPASAFAGEAAGALAIGLGPAVPAWLVWFRGESIETVTWAGDPRKPVVTTPEGQYLTPRRSFERWAETVRGRSAPWAAEDVEAADRLRQAIVDRLGSRREREGRLLGDLAENRKELDSFVYVASHDLKEPLRGIHKYACHLAEESGPRLDDAGRRRLDGLVRLADRMGGLIESLLHLSRVGRLDLAREDVDLNELAAEAIEIAAPRAEELGAAIRVEPLPTLGCDRAWVREVLVNLLTNGLKYNDKPRKEIRIGALPPAAGRPATVFVRDNGIGIEPRHREAVFALFRRLHGRDEFGGGTGAGLAIARKIVEHHGGRLWLESEPGAGTTFLFTLQPGEPGP